MGTKLCGCDDNKNVSSDETNVLNIYYNNSLLSK